MGHYILKGAIMALVVRSPYPSLWRHRGYPQGWYTRSAWPVHETLRGAWSPKILVSSDDDHVSFRVELPDVKPGDVDVSVDNGIITFKAERTTERAVEREGYQWKEESRSSFSRSVPLPQTADWEKAEASFEAGVLEVVIPRSAPAEPRHIPVHASEDEDVPETSYEVKSEEPPTAVEPGPEY
jgi:HSP20 family protein